jgi:hypothetical protein
MLLPCKLLLLLSPPAAACHGFRSAQLGTSTMIAAVEWKNTVYAVLAPAASAAAALKAHHQATAGSRTGHRVVCTVCSQCCSAKTPSGHCMMSRPCESIVDWSPVSRGPDDASYFCPALRQATRMASAVPPSATKAASGCCCM